MDFLTRFFKGHFGRFGLPFILLLTGSSFALSQVTDARYKASSFKRSFGMTKEELEAKGWKEDKTDLLEDYKKLRDGKMWEEWENIRGPKPWEADNQKYKDIIEQRIKDHEERKKKTGNFWTA